MKKIWYNRAALLIGRVVQRRGATRVPYQVCGRQRNDAVSFFVCLLETKAKNLGVWGRAPKRLLLEFHQGIDTGLRIRVILFW